MTTCQQCNTNNPSEFKFCQECGEVLIHLTSCPECGHHNHPDFRFCMECGHNLQPSSTTTPEPEQTPVQPQSQQPTPQPATPQPQYQPQKPQPQVIVIQEPQQPRKSPFISLITRFVTSMVVGFVLGKVWQILGETILSMF